MLIFAAMKKLKIQTGEDNPILRRVSDEVNQIDAGMRKFVKEMKKMMLKEDGLGLAAPQVGRNIRIVIVTLGYKTDNPMVTVMINPKILEMSDQTAIYEEGCLSLPKVFGKVERPSEVVVQFDDVDGATQVLKLDGMNARIVQHEMDHLNGVLFVDYLKGQEQKEKELLF